VRSLASEIREAVVMIFWFVSVTVLICSQIFKDFISGNQCLSEFRYVVKFLQIKNQSYFVLLLNLWPCVLQVIIIAGLLSGVTNVAFCPTSWFRNNSVTKQVVHRCVFIVKSGLPRVILRISFDRVNRMVFSDEICDPSDESSCCLTEGNILT